MTPIEVWERSVAVAILFIMVPAFIALFTWLIKKNFEATVSATKTAAESQKDAALANMSVLVSQFEELKGILLRTNAALVEALKDRNAVCTTDHTKLIEVLNTQNIHLTELTTTVSFVMDHFIKLEEKHDG